MAFLRLARHASAVLGVRLHSLILGAVASTPLVPLTYSAKVENLTKYLGLGAYTTKLDKPDFAVEPVVRNVQQAMTMKPGTAAAQLKVVRTRNVAACEELLATVRTLAP